MAFLGLPTKEQKAAKRETARNIVSPSASAPSITSTGPSDPPQEAALKIKVSLVNVDNLLKDSLVLSKVREGIKKKEEEKAKRAGKEQKLEQAKGLASKVKIPGAKRIQSFWQKLRDFFINVFWGWIAVKLVDVLPTLLEWLPRIGGFVNGVMGIAGKVFDGFAWAVDKTYALYDGLRAKIKDIFGEKALEVFDTLATKFKSFVQIAIVAGTAIMTLIAIRTLMGRLNTVAACAKCHGKTVKNVLKKTLKKTFRRVTNPGKFIKARTRLFKQNWKKGKGLAGTLKKGQKLLDKVNPLKKVQNLKKRGWKMPKWKTPGWMSKTGTAIKSKTVGAVNWMKSVPAKLQAHWDELAKKAAARVKKIGGGIWDLGKKLGEKWKNFKKNMSPQKVIDDIMAKVQPQIDDLVKKNPFIKQIMGFMKNPGKAKDAVNGILTKAANNPTLKKIIKTLKANKGASKGMGPIDKVITALTALADYTFFKESPINAIFKGLGGLLGYGLGFSLATAVPVLGQSGIFNFMGGMAGGVAGEWLAMKMVKQLAKTPLGEIEDPLQTDGRMIVRDPDGMLDHMVGAGGDNDAAAVEGDGEKTGTSNLKGEGDSKAGNGGLVPLDVNSVKAKNNNNEKIDAVSTQASYEEQEVIVEGSGSSDEVVVVNPSPKTEKVLVTQGDSGGSGGSGSDILYMGS